MTTDINKTQFFPFPEDIKSPFASYYAYINWENGFEKWDIVRFSTPMDGSCLFHAISNSFFEPYHSEILNGKHVSRKKMVSSLRKELAQKLAEEVEDDIRFYDTINEGNTNSFAKEVPEFNLEYMQSQLDSNNPIGYGYMEFIGNILQKDIYILSGSTKGIYVTDELPLTIKGDRKSIVLYYINGHYELVGIKNENSFETHFNPTHEFIQFLNKKVQDILLKDN
jgi:hypothetical protein